MRRIRVEKVTINAGAGTDQDRLKKSIRLIEMLTGIPPVKTTSKKRIPAWNLRPGLPIGCKVTLRGQQALDVLKRALQAMENKLPDNCFDDKGNVAFGIREYIDIPGLNYEPDIGIIGIQVCATLERPGFRNKKRKIRPQKIPPCHEIKKEDSIKFFHDAFNVGLVEKE